MSHTSIINDYIAGAIGGCAGIVVGHPLDTIKSMPCGVGSHVFAQPSVSRSVENTSSFTEKHECASCNRGDTGETKNITEEEVHDNVVLVVQIQTQEYGGKYSGLMDCVRTVHKQNLSKGYFRGLSWPLISAGYLNAIFLGSYGLVMKKCGHTEDTKQKPDYLIIWLSSAVASIPHLVFLCPVDVIKVTLQAQIPHTHGVPKGTYYNGPIEAAVNIMKKSGLRGIYRGFPTQIARDTPANCIYMVLYAFCQYEGKNWLPAVPSQIINFFGGGIAGVMSWVLTMPFDVVKSKLQADTEGKMYKGVCDCVRRVYAAEGVKAFFLGMGPVVMRAFPVNAVTLMVYTESLQYLKKLERSNE